MKVFNDYEELGKALKQARPEKFNQYRDNKILGLRYARNNPDKVRVKGLVEAYETQDFDPKEIALNLVPSAAELAVDTVEGGAEIIGQFFESPPSVIKSLANLAGGGADVLGRKVGLDLDLGTQEAEDMASLMGSEITQSLTPARINKDPATALANVGMALATPLRGAALGARGASALSKSGNLGKAADTLRKAADYAERTDPINLVGRVPSYVGRKAKDKIAAKKASRPDRSLTDEYIDEFFGFPASVGGRATQELRSLSEAGKENLVRKWRNMERGELFDKSFQELKSTAASLRDKSQKAYTKAMGTLSVPMRQVYPKMDQLKGNITRNLEEEFGSGINIIKKELKGQYKEGDTWKYLPVGQSKTKYTVSFNDGSGVLPEYRSQISKEIEEALNWGNKSGLDIHDWRRRLDKNISRMPGPTDFRGDTTPSAAAFKARTLLRKTISNDLKNTYDNIPDAQGRKNRYSKAMKNYEKISKLQRDASNFLGLTGTSFDDIKKESIIAELANTYNPNPRQSQRPKLLEKLERVTGNENLRAMTIGGLYNPFVSKGLAQRSEYAGFLRAIGMGALGGGVIADAPGAIIGAIAALPLQALYNPRINSEVVLRITAPKQRGKVRKSFDSIRGFYKSLPEEMKEFVRELPPNTPLQRGLERLANEYDLQLTDVNAEEGTKGQRRLLKTLGSAGTPNPSR
tara:strand:- start:489 stop:2564 length:2076 start_codon:yes stop_codon:yes gene_type:complete